MHPVHRHDWANTASELVQLRDYEHPQRLVQAHSSCQAFLVRRLRIMVAMHAMAENGQLRWSMKLRQHPGHEVATSTKVHPR